MSLEWSLFFTDIAFMSNQSTVQVYFPNNTLKKEEN